jgi:hypothetical protein
LFVLFRADFSPKAGDENPLTTLGWSLLWETRFGAGRVFPKGTKAFFGKPAERRGGLSKNLERTEAAFLPFLSGRVEGSRSKARAY